MALCIAYLCISSFSASFCKRNIIKIIMKIRFCQLSSLGAPVFMALVVPSGLTFWALPWAAGGDWILQRPWGWGRARDGHGGIPAELRGKDSPQTLQGGWCPLAAAGTGPSAPHPAPRAVPSGLGHPFLWGGLSRWRTCPAHAQCFLHSRSAAELDLAEPEFCPCPDPTDPPELLLPSTPQCSVGLCGILNVYKKSQVFLSYRETKHPLVLLPLHFWTPKAAIQWLFWKQQSSIWNYLKG